MNRIRNVIFVNELIHKKDFFFFLYSTSEMIMICPQEELPVLINMISKERHVFDLPNEDTFSSSSSIESSGMKVTKMSHNLFATALCFDKKGKYLYLGTAHGRLFTTDIHKKEASMIY